MTWPPLCRPPPRPLRQVPSAIAWSRQAIFRVRCERFRVRTGSPQTSMYRPTSSPVVIRSSRASSSLMSMLRGLAQLSGVIAAGTSGRTRPPFPCEPQDPVKA